MGLTLLKFYEYQNNNGSVFVRYYLKFYKVERRVENQNKNKRLKNYIIFIVYIIIIHTLLRFTFYCSILEDLNLKWTQL